MLHAADAGAREAERHLGRRGLEVVCEKLPRLVHAANATKAPFDRRNRSSPSSSCLACHDLRTPLATVHGFAQTLARTEGHDATTARYSEMIDAASAQLAELIDELSLGARIEAGRYDPKLESVEHGRARARRPPSGSVTERVGVSGEGAEVEVDVAASRALGRRRSPSAPCATAASSGSS